MANLNAADINLTFGVEGGASTASGSGKIMYEQIRAIVSNIEQKVSLGLKVNTNEIKVQLEKALTVDHITVTATAAENLRTQIQSILDSGNFTINVTGNINGTGQGSGGGNGGSGNSGLNTNQNNSGVISLGSSRTDVEGRIRRTTEAYRELNGVIRTVNTTFNNAGQSTKSVTLSNTQLASTVEGLGSRYDNLRIKLDTLRDVNEPTLGVTRVGQLAKEAEATTRRIENLRAALRSSLLGNENTYTLPKGGKAKVGLENVTNDQEAIRELTRYLEILTRQYTELQSKIRDATNETSRLATMTKQISDINTRFSTLNKLNYTESGYSNVQKQINDLNNLTEVINNYQALSNNKKGQFKWDQQGFANIKSYEDALKLLQTTIIGVNSSMSMLQTEAGNVSYSRAIEQAKQLASAYSRFMVIPGAEGNQQLYNNSEIQGYVNALATYNSEMAKGQTNSDKAVEALNHLRDSYPAITQRIKELNAASTQYENTRRRELNSATQINKVYQEADNYYKKYRSGIQANVKINQQWLDLMNQLRTGQFNNDELGARNALASLQTATKEANAEVMTLWGSMKKLFTDHFGSITATMAIGMIRNLLRTSYQYVLDIDKAMTELRKVTELTEAQYEAFGNTAARIAKEVGGSIADTIRSTADFARLGFSFEDSQALSKAALIYKNVGDGIESIDEASESIISTIKAFKDIDASDAMSIIDRFNEVGNNFSISSVGIGEALRRSAAALSAANNDINQSIGLAVAGNTVIQDPDVVGEMDAYFKSSYNG